MHIQGIPNPEYTAQTLSRDKLDPWLDTPCFLPRSHRDPSLSRALLLQPPPPGREEVCSPQAMIAGVGSSAAS